MVWSPRIEVEAAVHITSWLLPETKLTSNCFGCALLFRKSKLRIVWQCQLFSENAESVSCWDRESCISRRTISMTPSCLPLQNGLEPFFQWVWAAAHKKAAGNLSLKDSYIACLSYMLGIPYPVLVVFFYWIARLCITPCRTDMWSQYSDWSATLPSEHQCHSRLPGVPPSTPTRSTFTPNA